MNCRKFGLGVVSLVCLVFTGLAAPVIDPIPNATIPAGKSFILPITATSSAGRPLTYTITSSTNAFAVVMHTNNPFWQLTVAQVATNTAPGAYPTPYRGGLVTVTNVGTMTFELFPEYAPHTINIFQGLTTSGFYNSNTIFHRVVSNFIIQGGDPQTNGLGGLVFQYNDEFNPQAIFSGNGQLALANSGPNTDGSQFFVTMEPYRSGDFTYTIFGQMVRGFAVLTNLNSTTVDTNSRPLADEIIQTATYVNDTVDTVVTLTATNKAGITGKIIVIADDGAGGRTTNTFTATTVTDTSSNHLPLFFPVTQNNLVAPANTILTNSLTAVDLDGGTIYWYAAFGDQTTSTYASNSSYTNYPSQLKTLTYNVTNPNGEIQLWVVPDTNFVGPLSFVLYPSSNSNFTSYAESIFSCVIGDTPIAGQTNTLTAQAGVPFDNFVLATFTNGVPGSPATNFSAVINWGDDTTNTVAVTANAAGEKAVLGSHTYPYPGSYPVYVKVQSSIGANATLLSYVNVTNYPAPVTNLFTVKVSGSGAVSPAYSGTPLVVGNTYSVTASPSPLWLFSGWTDQNGFVVGTSTNLTFTLNPGLSLTANFLLAVPPTLAITWPTNGSFLTNLYSALATMTGTISNNATVTNVYFQLNGGGWQSASGTTNWTAGFIPDYNGSNFLQAYAINNFGLTSAVSSVLVEYLAGDILTVSTNGLGSIDPDLNGDLLPLGSNYVLTASPATGFTFAGWSGSLSTNNATLSFTMATNLSLAANFADGSAPKLTITSPTSGQQVKSNQFNVLGTTSSDNWLVANVLYSLNHSPWTNATNSGDWSSWYVLVKLAPGTNTLSAYAVDPNGQPSLTNTVNFQYLVTNQLQIQSFGKGTLSPNDSNAWLNIGQNYAITATAASGFAFTNWTISTNFTGGITTNSPTVQFAMASNLTLQVTFADITPPTLTITNLTAGQRITNSVFTLGGTAKDNVQVSNVLYQLNTGAWTPATTTNLFWTNWNAVLNLQPGTNTLAACAVDSSGNHSTTNNFAIDSVITNQLQIRSLGLGTINPNYSNSWLEIGRNYAITATPAAGFAVTNWTISTNWLGGIVTNSATVQFLMASNLTLQINFTETAIPTLTITWPANGQHLTNALPTVVGTTSDKWGIASVAFQFNNGTWFPPGTTNAWTNWYTTLPVGAGSNTFNAYAVNLGGNYSTTSSISVFSSNAFKLQLSTASAGAWATNGFNFSLLVSTNLYGHIQYSTNLAGTNTWSTLTNFAGTNATLNFRDATATNNNQRFYRAVIP